MTSRGITIGSCWRHTKTGRVVQITGYTSFWVYVIGVNDNRHHDVQWPMRNYEPVPCAADPEDDL